MLDFQPRDIPKDFAGAWRQVERLVRSIPDRVTLFVNDLAPGQRNIIQHGQLTPPKAAIVQIVGETPLANSVQIDGDFLYVYVAGNTDVAIELVL